jgi:hypothetical protein
LAKLAGLKKVFSHGNLTAT